MKLDLSSYQDVSNGAGLLSFRSDYRIFSIVIDSFNIVMDFVFEPIFIMLAMAG